MFQAAAFYSPYMLDSTDLSTLQQQTQQQNKPPPAYPNFPIFTTQSQNATMGIPDIIFTGMGIPDIIFTGNRSGVEEGY